MKINFVLANRSPNSISGVVTNFANYLSRQGHVIFISYPLIDHWDYYLWNLGKLYCVRKNKFWRLKYYLHFSWTVIIHLCSLRLFRKISGGLHSTLLPQIKHVRYFIVPNNSNMPDADFIVTFQEYLVPRLLKLSKRKGKVISSIRSDLQGLIQNDSPLANWFKRVIETARDVNVVRFAVSRRSLESSLRLGIAVEEIIQNGIDVNKFYDSGRRGRISSVNVTCFIDTQNPHKGPEFGLEVIRKVRALYSGKNKAVFRCFGSNSNLGSANAVLAEVFDDVRGFLRTQDIINYFRTTDIFIFPSFFEGFPSTILEAMACGCAVVTTAVSGVDELNDEKNVCLVSPVSDIDAMVQNIITVINNVELRDRLREDSLIKAAVYSWENATNKLISLLQKHSH